LFALNSKKIALQKQKKPAMQSVRLTGRPSTFYK